jgi:hypothetical protein
MTHLTEEDLVSYHYQESPDPDGVTRHLATCAACRAQRAALDRVFAMLDAPVRVPEPGPAYEREVWTRIQDRLVPERRVFRGSQRSYRWLVPQLALAACVTLLLVSVLLLEYRSGGTSAPGAGLRASNPSGGTGAPSAAAPTEARQEAQSAATIRDRVVLAAVGDHLQRAELMLTEFNNTGGTSRGTIDLTEQQAWAEDLVSENRLYRRSAADTQEGQIVALLDDLERVLLEVAHSPAETTPERLDRLRTRIGTQDVLFKVRVAGAGMRDRQQMAAVVDSPVMRPLSGS